MTRVGIAVRVRVPDRIRGADDRGSASLEFLTAGLLLLVPLVYLMIALSTVQAGALAAEGAARQAARVFVQAPDASRADTEVRRAVEVVLDDYGIDAADAVTVTCRPATASCLTRGGFVTATVTVRVPLPLLPAALGASASPAITLVGSATEQVSRFAPAAAP